MVIGYNSFAVKTLKVKDFITTENADHLSHVDVVGRRMYFHIMWIPLFPMWSIWMIRSNGKEVMAPIQIQAALLQKNIKVPTPWYTFAGLIFGVPIGLYFLRNMWYGF